MEYIVPYLSDGIHPGWLQTFEKKNQEQFKNVATLPSTYIEYPNYIHFKIFLQCNIIIFKITIYYRRVSKILVLSV